MSTEYVDSARDSAVSGRSGGGATRPSETFTRHRSLARCPVAPTPIAQSGVWNWSTSPLEGVAVLESVSVSVPAGSPGLVASGSRMISTESGPRLGRERLRNGGIQCEPVRDENPCAAWISTVSSTWHEPLILTTDQKVGGSSPSGRAHETHVQRREQVGGAIALVVMGHGLADARDDPVLES